MEFVSMFCAIGNKFLVFFTKIMCFKMFKQTYLYFATLSFLKRNKQEVGVSIH